MQFTGWLSMYLCVCSPRRHFAGTFAVSSDQRFVMSLFKTLKLEKAKPLQHSATMVTNSDCVADDN